MIGTSTLVLGPSGAGKSNLVRTALEYEGSGVVVMAPGDDESASYTQFGEGFVIRGFDDPKFLPTAGIKSVGGLRSAMKLIVALAEKCGEALGTEEELPYKVLAIDRMDGVAQLAVNLMLKQCGLNVAPKAMGKDGAEYYVGLRNALHEFFRPVRACKGLGMHVIVTSHVDMKEVKETASAGAIGEAQVPLIPGSFREQLPGIFDLVVYAGVDRKAELVDGKNDPKAPKHYVIWEPTLKQPFAKSRFGPLSKQKKLPNEWGIIKPLIDRAIERRRGTDVAVVPSA